MYVITRVFDDGWAEVYNTHSLGRQVKSPRELLAMKQDIIGMIVHNNKIVSLHPYKLWCFPTEYEADDFSYENNCNYVQDKEDAGYWWALSKRNVVEHVEYYIYCMAGDEITYVAEKGYTPYRQAAKVFTSEEVYEQANSMTKHSKTGKYWKVERFVFE